MLFIILKFSEVVLDKMQYKTTKLLKTGKWKNTRANFMAKCCILSSTLYSNPGSFLYLKCFKRVYPIYAENYLGEVKMFGFLAKCKKYDVIAIRSTASIADLLVTYDKSEIYTEYGCIHKGYYNQSLKILKTIPDISNNVYLTGHSLGGSLCSIMGFILSSEKSRNVKVYTFGSPRISDELFKSRMLMRKNLSIKNIINSNDNMCKVPKKYNHIGKTKEYSHDTGSLFRNHSIYTYLNLTNEETLTSNLISGNKRNFLENLIVNCIHKIV